MADLDQQIRSYAAGLDLGAPVEPADVIRSAPARHDAPGDRWLFVAAAAVLVVVVLGAAVLALRDDGTEEPGPTVDTTVVVPLGWERIGEVDGAQPFAMAASERGVVMVGYGAWWSADGSAWEAGFVTDLVTANVRPELMSDVIATDDGFLAVGTGYDKQPTVWRSADGRAWDRVVDPALDLPTGSIPAEVSTPYGSISSVVATGDGFVAVGSAFDGTFVGGTLTSSDPFRPAVWTSDDGEEWAQVDDLPDADGSLVAATVVDGDVVVLGTTGDTSYAWRDDGGGDDWREVGAFEGTAEDIAAVGGTLVAAGARNADREATPTLWSSSDGSAWTVVHEEPTASIARFTHLVDDGGLLVALGYTGPVELDTSPLMSASSDGSVWRPLPGHGGSGGCATATTLLTCPAVPSYPAGAAEVGGELLLATQERLPSAGPTTSYNLRTALYRSVSSPAATTTSTTGAGEGAVTTELLLEGSDVVAGSTLAGAVVVHNRTGAAVTGTGCGEPFAVQLSNADLAQEVPRRACLDTFSFPAGDSTWPVTVFGSFLVSFDGARPGPLPVGTYTATVLPPDGSAVPTPPPIEVEVR